MYEGGLRVPFLVQWPGTLPAGRVYDYPVSSLDIFATAAAVGRREPSRHLDGVNLIKFLTNDNADRPHETLFWRQGARAALRHGDWKIVRPGPNQRRWELFDLRADPGEKIDLAGQETARAAELIQRWEELNKTQMRDPLF
jgi:arylsulfatase B